MADGQQVRWWQNEEEPAQTAREASERVTVVPSPLLPETISVSAVVQEHSEAENDTWAELEAEAARRAVQAKVEETESLSFYTNKAVMLSTYRRYRRTASPFMAGLMIMNFLLSAFMLWQTYNLYQAFSLYHQHFQLPLFVFFTPLISLIAGCALNPRLVFRQSDRSVQWQQNSVEPAVRLSPQGIHLCTPIHKNVTISWGDIASVTLKGPRKMRHLEVRNNKKRRFVIPTLYLPITAEVLASRIADYRNRKAEANQVKL